MKYQITSDVPITEAYVSNFGDINDAISEAKRLCVKHAATITILEKIAVFSPTVHVEYFREP